MTYDFLFDSDGRVIGQATDQPITTKELAEALGKPESEIYCGKFRVAATRLVSSANGTPYTYWSKVGPINIATILPLSDVDGEKVHFFLNESGELEAFLYLEDAEEAGYSMASHVGDMDMSSLIIQIGGRAQNEFVKAYERLIAPYMDKGVE